MGEGGVGAEEGFFPAVDGPGRVGIVAFGAGVPEGEAEGDGVEGVVFLGDDGFGGPLRGFAGHGAEGLGVEVGRGDGLREVVVQHFAGGIVFAERDADGECWVVGPCGGGGEGFVRSFIVMGVDAVAVAFAEDGPVAIGGAEGEDAAGDDVSFHCPRC